MATITSVAIQRKWQPKPHVSDVTQINSPLAANAKGSRTFAKVNFPQVEGVHPTHILPYVSGTCTTRAARLLCARLRGIMSQW